MLALRVIRAGWYPRFESPDRLELSRRWFLSERARMPAATPLARPQTRSHFFERRPL